MHKGKKKPGRYPYARGTGSIRVRKSPGDTLMPEKPDA
jgi:hypothetical protein